MGFINRLIVLDSPTGAYYSGQMVNGRFTFNLTNSTQISGIHITAKGYCQVQWTTTHTRRERDRTVSYTVPHESYEDYICLNMYLFGHKNATNFLNPGNFEYPFSFQLPENCPSSFEGRDGHVRYELRAYIDSQHSSEETFRDFKVHAPLDLNVQNCKMPLNLDFEQNFCCCCVSSGSAQTIVKIPVTGYCPGQVIPIEIFSQNRSTVEIEAIKFAIKKELTFRATREPDSRTERELVEEMSEGPVPPHTDRRWNLEFKVPAIDVYNLNTCSFIDLSYELKVTVVSGGCHTDESDSCVLTIGTVPLKGFQDDVPNPLADQLPPAPAPYLPPQPIAPVVNNQVNAYPQHIPQMTPQLSAYPHSVSPNPYNQSPYPPQPIPPYSMGQNYPSPQMPFPQPAVPYPTPQPAPYPAIGMVGGQNPAAMPLLPMGQPPYPQRTSSPFTKASAPEPGSADADKPLVPTSSPYNPAFMPKENETKKE